MRSARRRHAALWVAPLFGAALACAPLPQVPAVNYAVDDDELRLREVARRVDEAAKIMAADPNLHLRLIGHADEDNSDAYNEALSKRRADTVRTRMLQRHPKLSSRISTVGRGEWDPVDRGTDDAAKAKNRRVEFRFYYPRRCQPGWSQEFGECLWGRLDPPAPARAEAQPEPERPVDVPPPVVAELAPEGSREYKGPYAFVGAGWSVSTFERVRQHVPVSLMFGYVWAPNEILRLSAGGEFEHNFELGPLFDGGAACSGACRQQVQALRVLPEFRIGAAQGRLWAHLKFFAGPVFVIRPRLESLVPDGEGGQRTVVFAARSTTGMNLGLGPGFTIRLGKRLAMSWDFDVSFDGRLEGGVGIYGGKLSFGAFMRKSPAAAK